MRRKGVPFLSRLEGLGSIVSSPSRVLGGALAAKDLGAFYVQFYAISRFTRLLVHLTAACNWEIHTVFILASKSDVPL